jgi:selenocysteine lyase/cysteine desulfurase
MATDWEAIRREFPALEHWTFLNTATFGQMPLRAQAAVREHWSRRDEFACADFLDWFDDANAVRGSIGKLIHCAAQDIAFFPNASAALALLMAGIEWKPGDRIVSLKGEFPNNLYFPAVLADRGVEFVECEWPDFYEGITPATKLVLLSSVNYSTGFRLPLEEIGNRLRESGVLLYVDGTQSVGALVMQVPRIQPDMLAVHGYKWMLAPTGAGFAYVSPKLQECLEPNAYGWRSHHDWRNVDQLHHGAPEPSATAEKYESGMLPFPVLYALGASVEMMLEIGPAEIEERVLALTARLRELLTTLGGELVPDTGSPIAAARFPGADASEVARKLKERRVLVSARHGNLRVSVHFYNNEQDLDRLGQELRKLLK